LNIEISLEGRDRIGSRMESHLDRSISRLSLLWQHPPLII
jgi:hypothetical protein